MTEQLVYIYLIVGIAMFLIGSVFIIIDEWHYSPTYHTNQFSEWGMWSVTWPITLPLLIAMMIYYWRTDGRA